MSPAGNKVYVSHVYYRIYIMITRSLSRWHSRRCACGSEPWATLQQPQRITQLGGWNSYCRAQAAPLGRR